MTAPDFLIIGAMKCATTTLHHQLAWQPGIFVTDKNDEPDYFSDERRYARGPQWYESLFAEAGPDDLLGDASTGYTKLPTYAGTAERLHRHAPEARLIYLMRHPIDRLVSHYIHEWSVGGISGSIDSAVASHRPLIDYGRYAMQLKPYLDRFGPERVLPVFFERLVSHPQAELERVCRFIGMPGKPVWVDCVTRTNVSSRRVRRGPVRDMLINTPVLKAVRRRLLPQRLRDAVKQAWTMDERPYPSPRVARRLTAELDKDLAELGVWLGVDLSCAIFRSVAVRPGLDWADAAARPLKAAG